MFIRMVRFLYLSNFDILTLGKDLVHIFCRGFPLRVLVRMLKYLELSKFDSLTLGKNLTCLLGSIIVSRFSTWDSIRMIDFLFKQV